MGKYQKELVENKRLREQRLYVLGNNGVHRIRVSCAPGLPVLACGRSNLAQPTSRAGSCSSYTVPMVSPKWAWPKASDPPRKMANAGAGLPPGTALTVPWKPMAAAWWPEQLDVQPEMQTLGRAPSGMLASRTACTARCKTDWLCPARPAGRWKHRCRQRWSQTAFWHHLRWHPAQRQLRLPSG